MSPFMAFWFSSGGMDRKYSSVPLGRVKPLPPNEDVKPCLFGLIESDAFLGSRLTEIFGFFNPNFEFFLVGWISLSFGLKYKGSFLRADLSEAFNEKPDACLRTLRILYPTRKVNLDRAAFTGPFLGIDSLNRRCVEPLYYKKCILKITHNLL